MKSFTARIGWIFSESHRLDASAFSGGGLKIRDQIQFGEYPWAPLSEVAHLLNAPRFARTYVSDPSRGIRFLSSSDILLADTEQAPLLSRAVTRKLEELVVYEGWTLISRSGTVGRTAYVRAAIAGMAASEHVMRAVPREGMIKPGYLFAFLSSFAGQALLLQPTYGSVVQHIEPHHIANLPVPLPDCAFQTSIHDRISRAATLRSEARQLFNETCDYYATLAGGRTSGHEHQYGVGSVMSSLPSRRLDAFHHVGWTAESRRLVGPPLGSFSDVGRPGMVRRIFVERGVPFVSGIDVYQVRVPFRQRLMRIEAERANCCISSGQILVQRGGQRYGLLGRPAFVTRRMNGWAASEDLLRIQLKDLQDTGIVFAYLLSLPGRRELLRTSYGTSIPKLNIEGLANLQIPPLPHDLASKANQALRLRETADEEEQMAINEVESWLG